MGPEDRAICFCAFDWGRGSMSGRPRTCAPGVDRTSDWLCFMNGRKRGWLSALQVRIMQATDNCSGDYQRQDKDNEGFFSHGRPPFRARCFFKVIGYRVWGKATCRNHYFDVIQRVRFPWRFRIAQRVRNDERGASCVWNDEVWFARLCGGFLFDYKVDIAA